MFVQSVCRLEAVGTGNRGLEGVVWKVASIGQALVKGLAEKYCFGD